MSASFRKLFMENDKESKEVLRKLIDEKVREDILENVGEEISREILMGVSGLKEAKGVIGKLVEKVRELLLKDQEVFLIKNMKGFIKNISIEGYEWERNGVSYKLSQKKGRVKLDITIFKKAEIKEVKLNEVKVDNGF